ncbi:imm11 family protein [Paenibacillus contaminans]|uniref:Immunity MXAN-0049 protein domain-containing protein n=1 Tax=Paenibacillus contaminans TaxID=450362 RepID=A0A329LSU8_9BACL|nr:DUF1629 domain-containing protein [Paenibacillus contaminans]RAV10468.1 hypothetical protein DQG23_37745 [Paenibacillus contaminans]
MKLWKLDSETELYDSFLLIHEEDSKKYIRNNFRGETVINWGEVAIRTSRKKGKTDCSSFGSGVPIFSGEAVNLLIDLMGENVQVLPLKHENEELYAINVNKMIDCIDFDHAVVNRDKDYPTVIKEIYQYAFKVELISKEHIFKTPQFKGSQVYVSDTFRNKVIESNLKGFKFHLLWDAKEGAEHNLKQKNVSDEPAFYKNENGLSFADALRLIEAEQAVVSREWKIQKDKQGNTLLGEKKVDGNYSWIKVIYYPPVFSDYKWYVVERSEI